MAAKVAFSGAVRTRLPMGRPDRKPERRATPEEPAPIVPSGPTVKAQVTSTAPAPAGRSFRDALCGGRGAAAAAAAPAKPAAVVSSSAKPSDEEVKEHAAAPVTHTPEAEAAAHKEHTPRLNGTHPHAAPSAERAVKTATAVHEAEEDRRTQQHAADEHAEQQRPAHTSTPAPEVISTSSAVVEQETHVPEHVEHAAEPVQTDMTTATHAAPAASSPTPAVSANAHFNWATDDEINFQIPSPAPQYMVHYPAGMLENRARNIVFKAPVHTLASAVDTLTKEQLSFEAERRTTEERLKAREIEQNHKEAELASRERHLAVEMEKLQQERLRFTQAQQAAAAQAAAAAAAAAQAASQQQQQQQQQQVQQQIPPQPTPTVAPVPSAPPQSVQQQPVAPASRGYMNMSAVYQDWPHTSQQQQSQPSQQQQHPHQHLPSQQQQQQQQQLPQQGGGRWNNGDMMPNDMVPTYDMYNGGYPNIFPQQPQPRNFHFFRGEQNRNNMGRMPHHMASNFSRVQSNRPPMETPVNFTARPPPQQQTLPQQYMGANIGNTYNKNW